MSVTHEASHEANSDDEAEADNSQENAKVIVTGTSQGISYRCLEQSGNTLHSKQMTATEF